MPGLCHLVLVAMLSSVTCMSRPSIRAYHRKACELCGAEFAAEVKGDQAWMGQVLFQVLLEQAPSPTLACLQPLPQRVR